jgi:predicted kinase
MNPIFVVVGAPAVGKSTTSRALAARFPRSVHIPVDVIRDMVVSGLTLPSTNWPDTLIEQVRLARRTASFMARSYHEAGFAVVIDDFWDPHRLADYQELFGDPAVRKVLLFPAQGEAHLRNVRRSGGTPARGYIDEGIQLVYGSLSAVAPDLAAQGWVVLDTTALTVEETVAAILQATAVES